MRSSQLPTVDRSRPFCMRPSPHEGRPAYDGNNTPVTIAQRMMALGSDDARAFVY